jgi:hypothetical protein
MSDYGRYGSDSYETRSRERSGRSRGGDSIFGSDRSRGDSDYGRSYRDNQPGGWIGSGATSDYDRIERENRERGSERGGSGLRSREHDRGSYGWRSEGGRDRGRSSGGDGQGRSRGYGRDDYNDDLPHDETSRLIASNKVEGTPVYSREGDRLGTIYNFMVDKLSGKVEYAVMSFGGFLGLGQRYYPLPWRMLDYDEREGGYVVEMSERDLEEAPSFGRHDEPRFNNRYSRHVHSWYGLQY